MSREYVFLRALDGRAVVGLGEVGGEVEFHRPGGGDVVGEDDGRRPERFDRLVDAPAGGPVSLARIRRGRVGTGEDLDGVVYVVEDEHRVVKGEVHVGFAQVVRRGVGKVFDVAHRVVGSVAHRPRAEARQVAGMHELHRRYELVQRVKGVFGLESPAFSAFDYLHLVAPRDEDRKRLRADEGVLRDAFAADHALQEKGIVGVLDLLKGRHRRQGVRQQLPVDRHPRTALGKPLESVDFGIIRRHSRAPN